MSRIITSIILFVISALLAECSIRHFLERGYLFNNAYIFAPKTERESMDKKPYYRQSAVVFLLMSAVFIVLGLAAILDPINIMWHGGSYQAFPLRWGMIPPRSRPMSHGPAVTMTRASGSMSGDITAATAPLWNRTLRREYRNTSAFTTSASSRPRLPAFASIIPPSAPWILEHSPSRPATPRMRS